MKTDAGSWEGYWIAFEALATLAKAIYLPMGQESLNITAGRFSAYYDGVGFRFDGPASAGMMGQGQALEPVAYTGEPSLKHAFLHNALFAAADASGLRVSVRVRDYLVGQGANNTTYLGMTGAEIWGR